MVFQWSRVDVESWTEQSWAPKNWCFWTVVLEKTVDSPLDCKEIQPVHPKGDQSWVFIGRTDAEAETPILWPTRGELTQWKRPWCWEGLGAEGEGDDRGWDGWMASLTWWTWVWLISGSWWWIGRPGVLRFMGSQRVRHDWVTELNRLNKGPCAIYSRTLLLQEVLDSFINCEEALEIIDFLYPTVISEVHWLSWALKCQ